MIDTLHSSPFAALTLIAAPAVLTNAASVLALGTSNRFARAIDRQRQLSLQLEKDGRVLVEGEGELRLRQLRRTEVRGQLLLQALTSFYTSLGSFAAASLLALVGAILGAELAPAVGTATGLLAVTIGLVGVGGLVFGCVLLVRETRVALESLREEADFTHRKFAHLHAQAAAGVIPPPPPFTDPLAPARNG